MTELYERLQTSDDTDDTIKESELYFEYNLSGSTYTIPDTSTTLSTQQTAGHNLCLMLKQPVELTSYETGERVVLQRWEPLFLTY